MQQAYQNFNAGKYKQALNNLSLNSINIDSYEPNLAICEYLANRCQQSSLNCLRKLNDLLARRLKRDPARTDSHTECILKLNIATLLVLQGKRDSALVVLAELYRTRDCFIEFMQSRVFLLLLELNALGKNALEVLSIHRYYLLRPVEQRGQPQQWISILLHEHGKTFAVAREEFAFMSRVYVVQALLQLGAGAGSVGEEEEKLREELLGRVKRRKNALSKYYEINVAMVGRFLEAQKQLHAGQLARCLGLMNFVNMVEEHEQMPTTKIITNILNAFATNNTGTVHFAYAKPALALLHFAKAKALLAKACTGVEDKDLHLFSLNYGNHIESVTYNQALALLGSRPRESYAYFESIRKSNQMSKNYKFWYRMGQAILQYYHDARTPSEQRKPLLQSALAALTNCLLCLDATRPPTAATLKNLTKFTPLPEEDIDAIVMRLRNEEQQFRQSIYTLICYVSLGLQLYRKVIRIALLGLEQKKLDARNRLNLLHYILEAEVALGKSAQEVRVQLDAIQQQLVSERGMATRVRYVREREEATEEGDFETVFYHWAVKAQVAVGKVEEAAKYAELIRLKQPTALKASVRDLVQFLNIQIGLDKKFVYPYLNT